MPNVMCGSNVFQPALALAPVRDAILRLDPSGSVLTTAHLYLIKTALDTRAYNVVVPVLGKFILYVPSAKDQLKSKYICDIGLSPASYITVNSGLTMKMKPVDIMEYFLYSGMIYIGLRRWADALECLENCVTYPAKDGAVSKIMVEAYKKWLLVSVLLEGKARDLPKPTTSTAAKAYHAISKPYEAVAQIFETGVASRLKAEVEHGRGIWENDCNDGLIYCILADYQKFQIRHLGNVYSKISIPEILNLTMDAQTGTKLPNALAMESLIRSMIQEGSLNATMSNVPGQPAVLTFSPSGPALTEAQMQRELAASAERIHTLTQDIKQTDRMLTHEKDYITYAKKLKAKSSKYEMQDQGIGGEMEWNAMEEEELMTGVF
jgi:COP9 signalosome complex subunit 3